MWNFFSFGLIMPSLRPAETVAKGDNRTIQIRGRRHRDVKFFVEHYMPEGSCSVDMPPADSDGFGGTISEVDPYIWDTPNLDYNCRTYCTPEDLAVGMAAATLAEIDYVKFKPSAERHVDNQVYHNVLTSIWGTLTKLGPAGGVWANPNYHGYAKSSKVTGTAFTGETARFTRRLSALNEEADRNRAWGHRSWEDDILADYYDEPQTFRSSTTGKLYDESGHEITEPSVAERSDLEEFLFDPDGYTVRHAESRQTETHRPRRNKKGKKRANS